MAAAAQRVRIQTRANNDRVLRHVTVACSSSLSCHHQLDLPSWPLRCDPQPLCLTRRLCGPEWDFRTAMQRPQTIRAVPTRLGRPDGQRRFRCGLPIHSPAPVSCHRAFSPGCTHLSYSERADCAEHILSTGVVGCLTAETG